MRDNTNKVSYPYGCFNLIERNICVRTDSGDVYCIIPQSVEIDEDRTAVVLIQVGQILNGKAINVQEITISGRVNTRKNKVACIFEIIAKFKGIQIHMPFDL